MVKRAILSTFLLTAVVFSGLSAQEAEVTVNEFEEPAWEWGRQPVYFDVTNHTDIVKFITLKGQLAIKDGQNECYRDYRATGYIEPQASTVLKIDILVPGNYGKAEVSVALHNVIDTMDVVLPGQEFFEQKFSFTLERPETMMKWKDLKLALPPRVENHPYFDNEFSRVIFALFDQGLSKGEIAGVCNASLQYVNSQIAIWVRDGMLSREENDMYSLTFPLIEIGEAKQMSALAQETAESLSSVIASNFSGYRQFLDSLAGEGKINADSAAVFGGTTVFYRPYATIAGLLLWYDLGDNFIDGPATFRAFKKDMCNSLNYNYMYMAPFGEAYNGKHTYAYLAFRTSVRFEFSDHPVNVVCPEDFKIGGSVGRPARWNWAEGHAPEVFAIDTIAVQPVLDKLGSGCDSLLAAASDDLDKLNLKFGYGSKTLGLRYWFWNLVATRCLDKLIDDGVVESDGIGHYSFNVREGL